jgi:hypothetical protein
MALQPGLVLRVDRRGHQCRRDHRRSKARDPHPQSPRHENVQAVRLLCSSELVDQSRCRRDGLLETNQATRIYTPMKGGLRCLRVRATLECTICTLYRCCTVTAISYLADCRHRTLRWLASWVWLVLGPRYWTLLSMSHFEKTQSTQRALVDRHRSDPPSLPFLFAPFCLYQRRVAEDRFI